MYLSLSSQAPNISISSLFPSGLFLLFFFFIKSQIAKATGYKQTGWIRSGKDILVKVHLSGIKLAACGGGVRAQSANIAPSHPEDTVTTQSLGSYLPSSSSENR